MIFTSFPCYIKLSKAENTYWMRHLSGFEWFSRASCKAAMVCPTLNRQHTQADSWREPILLTAVISLLAGKHLTHCCHLDNSPISIKEAETNFPQRRGHPVPGEEPEARGCRVGTSCESVLKVRVWKWLTHQAQPSRHTPCQPTVTTRSKGTPALSQPELLC